MNTSLACFYAVIRFCPYAETDEFVNVGIVLACPEANYLSFKRARKQLARVSHFFPELNMNTFGASIESLDASLSVQRSANADKGADTRQTVMPDVVRQNRDAFMGLVRPRETILSYSEPRVIMSDAPEKTLDSLYEAYVERRFAQTAEYQEYEMSKRLRTLFSAHNIGKRFKRNQPVGNSDYTINFPFVSFGEDGTSVQSAIKTLYLNKQKSTDIFTHGDRWRVSIERLRSLNVAPQELLFVVSPPEDSADNTVKKAYARVMEDYKKQGIRVVEESQSQSVLDFAQAR